MATMLNFNPLICRVLLGTVGYCGVLWGTMGCCGVLWGTMGEIVGYCGGTVATEGYWRYCGVLGGME